MKIKGKIKIAAQKEGTYELTLVGAQARAPKEIAKKQLNKKFIVTDDLIYPVYVGGKDYFSPAGHSSLFLNYGDVTKDIYLGLRRSIKEARGHAKIVQQAINGFNKHHHHA